MAHSKLVSLDEAVASVHDGMSITAGGFAHSHQPMAFFRALMRTGVKDLTIMGVAECWVAEWLAAAGMLRRAYFSNFMFEGFGRCRRFSEGIENGTIEAEDHSHFGMVMRFMAAGLGLPFMPMRSQAGTDIMNVRGFENPSDKARMFQSPFDGEMLSLISPLKPDIAVIHAARADELGNVELYGTTSVIEEQVRAAAMVIVTVEEIVSTDEIRRNPQATLIPGMMVDKLVHLPYGAFPLGVYGYYEYDNAALAEYYEASRSPETTRLWLDKWVHGIKSHWEYLDAHGASRLLARRTDPHLGYKYDIPEEVAI
ncbi:MULTISPECIES: CoA transferase subunit A [Brucella]|uniref:Coenzyme A transferase family protein n=1 Tax=Brucella lupini TaxID=255457 RepID=A0A256GFH8_9HYPH|nr:CoA-transferase [Brucella lupini]OYR25907.1 coenzyme A transferase family protein [Brucella lupini]